MSESQAPQIDLRDIVRVLVRRRWILALPWSIALLAGLAAAFLLKQVYLSTVKLVLEHPPQVSDKLQNLLPNRTTELQAEVMREQVKSSLFLTNVITATGLKKDPAVMAWVKKNAHRQPGLSDAESQEL